MDSLVARLTPADLVVVTLVDTLRVLIRSLTCIASSRILIKMFPYRYGKQDTLTADTVPIQQSYILCLSGAPVTYQSDGYGHGQSITSGKDAHHHYLYGSSSGGLYIIICSLDSIRSTSGIFIKNNC